MKCMHIEERKLQQSREERFTSRFQFEEEYSTINLVEEPLIYVRRSSDHWVMNFDSVKEHNMRVARGAKMSSRGTKWKRR